ncbi:MAG: CocE/NonD family hydrolase [Xanthobacteraceae bacterium]
MKIEWDVPIVMDDSIVLRADVFRPDAEGRYPVILSYGPYGKGLAFQEGWKNAWDRLVAMHPNVLEGTSAKYANFEVVDPEKWVPDGYVIVRVDSRGAGRSPGFLDPKSVRETKDLHDCIEWAGTQPWSNGKVGLNGISYFATNQWYVAPLQPPHLAAMCVWEGASDYYRENTHHGGILSTFALTVNDFGVWPIQHGMGERGRRSRATGELVSGPETLSPEELKKNRIDLAKSLLSHPLDDRYYRDRVPDWSKVKVPFLSAANWGGVGLHPRGNFEGFMRAASEQKWLEAHGSTHWAHFYSSYGEALQKRFFAHFLKGEDNGWDRQPRVQLQVRHPGEKFVERHENEWPLERTQWTKFYPASDGGFGPEEPSVRTTLTYDPTGDGLTFLTPTLEQELEITGPVAAKLFVSSASTDADLFLVLRVFAPDGKEVVFQGSNDPRTPVGLGWLRASHRKLDPVRTLPYRPYHPHDEVEPLTPGVPVELDVEIWPTCIVVPPGYRVGFSVRGNDYRYDAPPLKVPGLWYEMTGVGPFKHDSPEDRPADVFGATVTLHFEPGRQPYVLLPIIPPR